MAFKVCCKCGLPRVLKPIRRWLQWQEILDTERTVDTVDWINEVDQATGHAIDADLTVSPKVNAAVSQTLYMKPVRFRQFGAAATPNDYNPSHGTWNERALGFTTPAVPLSGHTFDITSHEGMIPSGSHCSQIRLTQVVFDVPGFQEYYTVPSTPFTPSTTFTTSVDAARLRVNGVDITGIVSGSTPVIKFINSVMKDSVASTYGWKSDSALSLSVTPTLIVSETDLIEIDIWYKIEVGSGWCPQISLGVYDIWDFAGNPSRFRISTASTQTTGLGNSLQLPYIGHATLYATNVNNGVPRGYPWTISFPVDAPWTPGNAGDIDVSTTPADSTYSIILRPVASETVTPNTIWDDTTVTKIDETVIDPDAGDGLTAFHGPNNPAATPASGRWRCTTAETINDPITKVIVWYYANCDTNSDGNITSVQFRYTVSGTTYVRTATPAALSPTRAWKSVEFTGADISGLTAAATARAQLIAECATTDAFVELDTLYIEYQMNGEWARTEGETDIYLEHSSGDYLSFYWGREIPELILNRNVGVPGFPVTSNRTAKALYRPIDSGDYFSAPSNPLTLPTLTYDDAAGVWDPKGATTFRLWGVLPTDNTTNDLKVWGLKQSVLDLFPETVTVTRN